MFCWCESGISPNTSGPKQFQVGYCCTSKVAKTKLKSNQINEGVMAY